MFRKLWPLLVIIFLIFLFYKPFFTKGLLPIPADIVPGMYYPWLDYKFPEFPVNIPVKNPLPSDVVSLTLPLRLLSINLLKDHQWPLWNSFILCGTPLLANFQSASLYWLNIFYFIINDFNLVWSWQVIAQPLLGLIFTYLFLRHHSFSQISSLFGAITWSFGSFFSIWGQYNTVIHAILYLPLGLLSLNKFQSSPIWGVSLSVSIALSIFAGNPPMTLVFLLALATYYLFLPHSTPSFFLKTLFFITLALGLASPLLLPGFANSKLSVRGSDSVAVDNQIKFLPLRQLVTLVSPDFYGNPTTLNYWAPGLYDNLTIFVGVVPLLLFLLSFYQSRDRHFRLIVFSWLLFFGSFVLMIKNPLSSFVGTLPFLGLSSMVMTRFFSLTSFAVAIGACFSLEQILYHPNGAKYRFFTFISTGILVAIPLIVAFFVLISFKHGSTLFDHFPSIDTLEISKVIRQGTISVRNSALSLIIFCFTVFFIFISRHLRRHFLILAIFVLTIFDLFRFFRKYNTFSPSKYLFPQNPTITFLQQNSTRFLREGGELLPSNMWMPYGLRAASGYDTLYSSRYGGFVSLINGGTLQGQGNRYVEIDRLDSPFLDFLGISHLLSLKRKNGVVDSNGEVSHPIDPTKYSLVHQDKSSLVFKNNHSSPILFPVTRYQVATSIESLNQFIATSDLRSTVILEKDPKLDLITIPQISHFTVEPQKTYFNSTSATSSLIVTSQTFDPGWQLYIDDLKSEIFTANYAFMAFKIPPGRHSIYLVYQPTLFTLGLKIFAVSSITTLIITLFPLACRLRTKHLGVPGRG